MPSQCRRFAITPDTPDSVGLLGRVIRPSQTPVPDTTQHLQETDIQAPGEIRTRCPYKRAAADPHLRSHGHWDRQFDNTYTK